MKFSNALLRVAVAGAGLLAATTSLASTTIDAPGNVLATSISMVGAPDPTSASGPSYQRAYKTSKSTESVQNCLREELADLGDQDWVFTEDSAILVIREGSLPALMIDIAPPNVTIRTRSAPETQIRVKRCV
jgi:hypothetical protein